MEAFSVEDFAVQWFHKASIEYVFFYKFASIDPQLRATKSKIFLFTRRINFIAFDVLMFKLTSVIPEKLASMIRYAQLLLKRPPA
jgi:hypothetical protein